MQPESIIVNAILKRLHSQQHTLGIKIHGSPFARKGEPDIIGCCQGRFFAFEVKTATGKPTRLQLHRLEEWRQAGAIVGIVRSVEEVLQLLEEIEK